MSRILFPALGVLGLALLIGCGGGGGGGGGSNSTNTDGTTGTDGTSGTTGTTGGSTDGTTTGGSVTTRAAAGTYGIILSGTLADGTTFTGNGTGVLDTDGALTLDYTAKTVGTTPVTTTRKLVATVAGTGTATGTVTVDSGTPLATSGTLSRTSDGSPRFSTSFTRDGQIETDLFAFALRRPAAGAFDATASGTDTTGGVYTGSGIIVIPTGVSANGPITISTRFGDTTITQVYGFDATIAADGTIAGYLRLPNDSGLIPTTGRVGQSASGAPQLILNYTTLSSPAKVVTQTLALTRR